MKENKIKIIEAHPNVMLLAGINIRDEEKSVAVGGFTIDGGFYLREGFKLVAKEDKNIIGENVTYFNFVKDTKKKCSEEKEILRRKRKDDAWRKNRVKELQKELEGIRKK